MYIMESPSKLNLLKDIIEAVENNLTEEEVKSKLNWLKTNIEHEEGKLGVRYTIEFVLWK